MNEITFNKPYLIGKETAYICEAVKMMQLSGNGEFTKRCQSFFEKKYGFKKCLLTTSCTDALEMAAMLCNLQPGDEVIVPSYTFVSTALAFVREGAKIVFADSMADNPNRCQSNRGIDNASHKGNRSGSLCGSCLRYGCNYENCRKKQSYRCGRCSTGH